MLEILDFGAGDIVMKPVVCRWAERTYSPRLNKDLTRSKQVVLRKNLIDAPNSLLCPTLGPRV